MAGKRPEQLTLIAFVLSTLLGGNNAIAVRFSNVELPPFFGAALRFGVASAVLFLIVFALRLPLPRGRSLVGALIFGSLQFGLSYAFIYWSLLQVQPGMFQVVFAVTPLLTFCLAILHRQEVFQWRVLLGGLLALSGIALVFGNRLTANVPVLSLLAIILAAACVAESVVLFKTFPKSHPITTNALAMAMGALILLGMSWAGRETPHWPTLPPTWLALLYLVFLGSIATFVLALYVLARWSASVSSYQLVLLPIVTVLFSAWLTGETVTGAFVAGGLLVLAGVYVGAIAPAQLLNKLAFWRRPA